MPRLLLSVRGAHEASLALDAGVDLVDVKEPLRGPLGAASPEIVDDILRKVDRRAATSVACGELLQCDRPEFDAGYWPDYIKVGLSGCASIADWPVRWRQFLQHVPSRTTPVAVIYADWSRACSPRPAEVIEHARRLDRAAVLIDTFDKRGPGMLRLLSMRIIQSLVEEIHTSRMEVALAGQLTLDDALAVAALGPDYVGVRGAVCRPDRNGDIDPAALAQWRRATVSAGRRETSARSADTCGT
jgi:uncharacterized protein (UPF0264 family)